jgi:succinate dehydrogenase / fumarate reductase cytochrome b subunit
MNVVVLISSDAYNTICELLGDNWYALIGTAALAFLAVCHFVYAFILTAQNRRARGEVRYEVTSRRPEVEWASQNMLVLGIIILLGLCLHLYNFWSNMMWAELTDSMPSIEGVMSASDGAGLIAYTFSQPVYVVLYIIWLCALWFHLTHGFWSSMQTLGWNGKIWFSRWKCIGNIYATLLVLCFLAVVLVSFFKSLCGAA